MCEPTSPTRIPVISDATARRRFRLVLIKPSHYDDDGYVIQWFRSSMPSNSLAAVYGLAMDCAARQVLGPDTTIEVDAQDETNTRLRPDRIAAAIKQAGAGMVCFTGVQSNQYPRALDLGRRFRALGVDVAIGGFHVSGTLAMLPAITPELQEAMDLGIVLYAGEAEDGLEPLLRDAAAGTLRPLYNHMANLPNLANVPIPYLPPDRIARTAGRMTTFDAGRGCPFQCSFCTIINVQGRVSRRRHARRRRGDYPPQRRPGHPELLHHRRQFRPQQGLGADFRPPDRPAGERGLDPEAHHPGRHAVPPHSAIHREGRTRRRGARVHRP